MTLAYSSYVNEMQLVLSIVCDITVLSTIHPFVLNVEILTFAQVLIFLFLFDGATAKI